MSMIRIPYTAPFPPAIIYPPTAISRSAGVTALQEFLLAPHSSDRTSKSRTLVLTGAGVSVESGLADYRGENGTYRLNKKYRPIFYTEFISNHEARKRYWARSFLGWPTMGNARPNKSHMAIALLGATGLIHGIITQNVDSLHHLAHPQYTSSTINPSCRTIFDSLADPGLPPLVPPIVEIHGTLRHTACLTCSFLHPRNQFQHTLEYLNPAWTEFLHNALNKDAFNSNATRGERIRTNPDGDVDLPGAPYTKFRYPPCPKCLSEGGVEVDKDGAHIPHLSGADYCTKKNAKGILKPNVVFFGEGVQSNTKNAADQLVKDSERILVIGSSLAAYSALKLVREVARRGKGVGIINIGGVRGEAEFFEADSGPRLRLELPAADVLGDVVEQLEGRSIDWAVNRGNLQFGESISGFGG
ncbi:DHS-like NAD/FAD-binding domain-containing protein [Terfezia claveryi]|nr:DHS-like NAD/FAD-binding domain-containing protein [Terfezia claveryi]